MHQQFIPYLQIRSKSAIYYQQPEFGFMRKKSILNSLAKQQAIQTMKESAKYTGTITAGSKKRLTKAVSLLVQSTPTQWLPHPITGQFFSHKLSFVTLTLPNVDKCKDAKYTHKYLLQPMLRILRNKYAMTSYVWKSELQANGTVHYHLTSDVLLSYSQLNEKWNNILRGQDLLNEFRVKYGHDNPNSTDIHSVRKIKDMEAYLVKYVAKESQNQQSLGAKVWDCSQNLKASNYYTTNFSHHYDDQFRQLQQQGILNSFAGDRYCIFKFKSGSPLDYLTDQDKAEYSDHMRLVRTWNPTIRHQSRQLKKPLEKPCAATPMPSGILRRLTSISRTCNWSGKLSIWQGIQTVLNFTGNYSTSYRENINCKAFPALANARASRSLLAVLGG